MKENPPVPQTHTKFSKDLNSEWNVLLQILYKPWEWSWVVDDEIMQIKNSYHSLLQIGFHENVSKQNDTGPKALGLVCPSFSILTGFQSFPDYHPDTGKTPSLSILPSGSLFSKINVGLTLRTTSSNLNFGIACLFKIFPWGSPRMKYKLHRTIRNLHYMVTILPSGHNAHDCKRQVPYSNITKHFFAPKLLWVSFRFALHFFYCSHLKCPLPPSPKSHHPVCLLQIPSPAALTGPLLLWNSVMFVIMIIGRTLSSQPGQTVLGNWWRKVIG